ncbi:MAG: adenylate/guanylate cyclase domain-containing protein [Alphaproteobacteria bacterium]
MTRRLAAILAADVAGYSRLMAADEAGTLARLKLMRADHFEPAIRAHGGRLVGEAGDSLLVEFASASAAVTCAVEVQEKLAALNAELSEDRRMRFRMGINLGEVIADGATIHGDGVNIAARLEKLAEPGGILVARAVHEQVKGKVPYPFEDLGETTLHNIAEPVRAYQIDPAPWVTATGDRGSEPPRLPDVASVAVLPFVNMSSDPEQDYFADGMTEDIITDLSRWRSLAVASRNSTFRFKGKPVDMQRVGRELGARFLVEGSVRRMGERIRVTAQLIDAESGNHLWAERFDRPMADLFAVQDEMVRTIVGTLVGRVQASAAERAGRKPPSNWAAYDYVLRGNALPWDDPASAAEAKHAFERAIELDPGYGLPRSLLAVMLDHEWANDFSGSRETLDRAFALAQRAVELAENESTCHMMLGQICLERRSFDLALRHTERGVEINPVNQWNRADLGIVLSHIGRAEEGLETLRNARRVDPYFGPPWYWRGLGIAQFVLRRYADALADFDRGAASSRPWALAMMAGCCAKLGLADRAAELVARCLEGRPGVTIDKLVAKVPFKLAGDSDHLAECLRLAGIPE